MYSVKPVFFPLVLLCNALFIRLGCMYKANVMRKPRPDLIIDPLHFCHPIIQLFPKATLVVVLQGGEGGGQVIFGTSHLSAL